MTTNALAGIAVKDLADAVPWYQRFSTARRTPNRCPRSRSGVRERRLDSGVRGRRARRPLLGHAGGASLDERVSDLQSKAIEIQSTSDAESVRTAIVVDPDGNQLVFAQAVEAHQEQLVLTRVQERGRVLSGS